jgi:hypothetical protein
LCAFSKNIDRYLDKLKKNFELIRQISSNKKVCFIANATSAKFIDAETRKYIENEMSNLFKAMDILSDTASGKVNTSISQNIKTHSIPLQIFQKKKKQKNG